MSAERSVLVESCEAHGDAIAYQDGSQAVSYGDLLSLVERQSAALAAAGVGCGDRITWCPRNDLETLVAFWSIFALGAVACPISHRFPRPRQVEIANRLRASWLPTVVPDETSQDVLFNGDIPATVILSSGSMGEPKAIVHTLEAHIASARGAACNMPLCVGDSWLWALPTYHVSGLSILFRCALAGATVRGMHESENLSCGLLHESGVTHLSLVAAQLRRLMHEKETTLSELKALLLGGGTVPDSLVHSARERGIPVCTTYGLSEMASQVTTSSIEGEVESSGRLLPHRQLMVNASGEILVRGDTLCLGYLIDGRIESVVDEQGWFHTGDLGRLSTDGELTISGRRDNMFVAGGENIHPECIERALLRLPGVDQAIVVPRKDDEFGERPVAFVDGDWAKSDSWSDWLRGHVAGYEIPVEFLQWPSEAKQGIKPCRWELQERANRT